MTSPGTRLDQQPSARRPRSAVAAALTLPGVFTLDVHLRSRHPARSQIPPSIARLASEHAAPSRRAAGKAPLTAMWFMASTSSDR